MLINHSLIIPVSLLFHQMLTKFQLLATTLRLTATKKTASCTSCRNCSPRSKSESCLSLVPMTWPIVLAGTLRKVSNSRTCKNSCEFFSTQSSSLSSRTISSEWLKICTWASAPASSNASSAPTSQRLKTSFATCSCPSRMNSNKHLQMNLLKKLCLSICARLHWRETTHTNAQVAATKSKL